MKPIIKAGSLVSLRNRRWVVQPSPYPDVMLLRPLGGSEEELTGVYTHLDFQERPVTTRFPAPTVEDLGRFESAKLLYNASRLSFRNAAGPFRCIGKLSFRPRAYQMVPLIMALRQEKVKRLLIADDVGIGKTIESLMIVRELLDRGEIKRFAVVCLPHLCEQWQQEILDKFGIEAVIIRSSTAAQLDRKISSDESVFHFYPYQVISIDYIKSLQRRQLFIHECPRMVIIDEAHTCAKPKGATKTQQQRYHLLYHLAQKPEQHLLLLTATPHSGKPEEFQSLLGLLNTDFEEIDIEKAPPKLRRTIAAHFVQRRRKDIEKWMNETTPFPKRQASEKAYSLSTDYRLIFQKAQRIAKAIATEKKLEGIKQRFKYFTALALLRGIMSSPEAGIKMLKNRIIRQKEALNLEDLAPNSNPIADSDFGEEGDYLPTHILEQTSLEKAELKSLKALITDLEQLKNPQKDRKLLAALDQVKQWLRLGFHPIVYCRYIETAKYVGQCLKDNYQRKRNVGVEIVTSELGDEERRERVEYLGNFKHRVLIATDCMSEGINLQQYFTAVLHYDLPWNPNRLEQREGRVDRFGQTADTVKIMLLYGTENPIDSIVLKVLLQKARKIRNSIGISVPFPDDSKTIMDAVLNAVLFQPESALKYGGQQMTLDFDANEQIYQEAESQITHAYQQAEEREKATRSIFAQNAIKPQEIEVDLKAVDEVIGDVSTVENFVRQAIRFLGAQMEVHQDDYRLYTTNLPSALKSFFEGTVVQISFRSPTPEKYVYIGRNHPFVEQLCQVVLHKAVERKGVARAAVVRTKAVKTQTVLVEFRVRNVICNRKGTQELIAEEMILWGYTKNAKDKNQWLGQEEAKKLLNEVVPSSNISPRYQAERLESVLQHLQTAEKELNELAYERAENLVAAHERFRKAMAEGHRFKVVEPVLPMDQMGIYVFVPAIQFSF